jgi:hypothetical protein
MKTHEKLSRTGKSTEKSFKEKAKTALVNTSNFILD